MIERKGIFYLILLVKAHLDQARQSNKIADVGIGVQHPTPAK
jgi:hypothetical protein